jgi:tRNA U34 5-carboxymethylaminomethyl modifying GTPase MnmE/TrmE
MLFQLVRTAASRARPAAFLAVNPSVVSTSTVRQSSPVTASTRAFSSLYDSEELLESGYKRPGVQWYPGHIAKAERQLAETLKAVDVVVEVRDARACKATAHPRVGEWCAGSPRIVVLTHLDMIPKSAANAWRRAYEALGAERWDEAPINSQVANQAQQAREVRFQYNAGAIPDAKNPKSSTKTNDKPNSAISPVEQVLFVNARQGEGIHALHRAIFKAGSHVQERRERRGLNARALRVGIIGYPNVGKVRNTLVALERKKPAALITHHFSDLFLLFQKQTYIYKHICIFIHISPP